MAIFVGILITLLVTSLIYIVLKNWKYYYLLLKLPSLKRRLIFGNILELLEVRGDMSALIKLVKPLENRSLICFWMFHIPYVFLTKHNSAEVILRSSQEIQKPQMYDLVGPWLGNGLLVSSGKRWRSHRKLLNPSFHIAILESFIPIFNEQSRILVSLLSKHAGKCIFDVYPYITRCAFDVICETAMGKRTNTQFGKHDEYFNAINTVTKTVMDRMYQPWMMIPIVFDLSPSGRRQKKCLKIIHEFAKNVIREKRKKYEESMNQKTKECIDETIGNEVYGRKNRRAFLDNLIEASCNGEAGLTNEMIREETDTFMFAGHDTVAVNITWVLYWLGWCPSVQEIAHQELDRVFGNTDQSVCLEDLNELKYLEAVIKETLRLVPSVPIYGRHLTHNIDIDGYEIPSGAEVFIWASIMGFDSNIYSHPQNFDPTRFLNSDIQKNHPYAFVPFSAGPRNCIGQKFAMMEEKVILANILRKYEIRSYNDLPGVKAANDLVYRPANGLYISLESRSVK